MKIKFDWAEVHLNVYDHEKVHSPDVYGHHHEFDGMPTININLRSFHGVSRPDHVLPGVVDDITPACILAHELAHHALDYGEAAKKAKMTSKQEEAVCWAIGTVFGNLFSAELDKLINKALKGTQHNVHRRRKRQTGEMDKQSGRKTSRRRHGAGMVSSGRPRQRKTI